MSVNVKFRPVEEADISFIYSSWLKSYRNAPSSGQMNNDIYYDNHKEIIKNIIEAPSTLITMICNPEDEAQLYGYAVIDTQGVDTVVHYVYTKYSFRKFGLAKQLMSELLPEFGTTATVVSHANRNWEGLKAKYNLVFNPFLLRR